MESDNQFWRVLRSLGPVPKVIENFLTSMGFDSYVALRRLTDENLKTYSDQKGLLPGHRTVLLDYRNLCSGNTWEKLLRQSEKITLNSDNSKRAKEIENVSRKIPDKNILDAICDRFQVKLAQWVNLHGAEAHHSVENKDFQLKRITEGHETKIGVSCPFCPISIMLFFKMLSNTSFHVTISNYVTHYNHKHISANSKEFGKKQTNLLEMCKPSKPKLNLEEKSNGLSKVIVLQKVNAESTSDDVDNDHSDESLLDDDSDIYEEDDRDLDYEIQMVDGGKFQTSFHVPSAFFAMLIGAKGATRKRLEAETRTQIIVPKQGTDGDVTVKGSSRKGVTSCRQRIELIVLGARSKQQFTHFLSIPLNSEQIRVNYAKFRERVLTELPGVFQLDESLFQRTEKLHLTLCTLSLMDNEDRALAAQLLRDCQETIVDPIMAEHGPIDLRLAGLKYMNDNPHAVDVLYAKVESDVLQNCADQMMEYFVANGLMQRKYDRVRLHVTLINSLFRGNREIAGGDEARRGGRVTFDAVTILKEFGHFEFGTQRVSEIHLSQRYSTACDGFYEATGLIKL